MMRKGKKEREERDENEERRREDLKVLKRSFLSLTSTPVEEFDIRLKSFSMTCQRTVSERVKDEGKGRGQGEERERGRIG